MTKKNKQAFLSLLLISLVAIALLSLKLEQLNSSTMDLPPDGTPVLVLQNKVGDDTVPHIHQTYCQILPYKRRIQDDGVFCYVETIDDWSVGN